MSKSRAPIAKIGQSELLAVRSVRNSRILRDISMGKIKNVKNFRKTILQED